MTNVVESYFLLLLKTHHKSHFWWFSVFSRLLQKWHFEISTASETSSFCHEYLRLLLNNKRYLTFVLSKNFSESSADPIRSYFRGAKDNGIRATDKYVIYGTGVREALVRLLRYFVSNILREWDFTLNVIYISNFYVYNSYNVLSKPDLLKTNCLTKICSILDTPEGVYWLLPTSLIYKAYFWGGENLQYFSVHYAFYISDSLVTW